MKGLAEKLIATADLHALALQRDAAHTTYISYFSRNKETVFISLLKKQQSFEGYESDDQSVGLLLTTCCVIRKKGKLSVRGPRGLWRRKTNATTVVKRWRS